MKNLIKNTFLAAITMMFLNSCSTQDENSKNAVEANLKNVEKRLAAAAPIANTVTELVFRNNSTNKTLVVGIITAVGRAPGNVPVMFQVKDGLINNNSQNLIIPPGQTVTYSDLVSVTTINNTTGATLPINNTIAKWGTGFIGGAGIGVLGNQTALNTYGFNNPPSLPAGKYVKWDWVGIAAIDQNGQYYATATSTPNGAAYPGSRFYLNASAGTSSVLAP